MSKRHVAYIKPDEPSFLKKLKQQAGFTEGPTVDTKREGLDAVADEDLQDTEEEQPTVVVLKSGDLTAEEAAQEAEKLRKETEEAPADLSSRIVFKAPGKSKSLEKPEEKSSKRKKDSKDKDSKKLKNKKLLSFDEEEDEDY
ncbi:uncharacterized protein KIAA1143 homolog [Anoplophora glabripennis]|uniref:uncharacterized protein KIAA1143 homolog n=1 Tax=Anoplophora glabripennis TaxID=217634 RepID=UPI000875665E|nr:uncharacterized protein KIAA1143 homolog [Anoplophora glabripennis]